MLSRHKNQNAAAKSKINAGVATFVNNAATAASEINAFKNDAVAAASKINYNATNASKSLWAPLPNLNCGRSIRIATACHCHHMSLHVIVSKTQLEQAHPKSSCHEHNAPRQC